MFSLPPHVLIAFIFLAEHKAEEEKRSHGSISNVESGRDKKLPSFWIPSLTPEASATVLKKPVSELHK